MTDLDARLASSLQASARMWRGAMGEAEAVSTPTFIGPILLSLPLGGQPTRAARLRHGFICSFEQLGSRVERQAKR